MKNIYTLIATIMLMATPSLAQAKEAKYVPAPMTASDFDVANASGNTTKVDRAIFWLKTPVIKKNAKKAAIIGKYKDLDALYKALKL